MPTTEKYIERANWLRELKEQPCMDCGGTFPPECMDFDHRPDTTKSFHIATAIPQNRSLRSILDEIEKCDLICANCHRIRTYRRHTENKNGYRYETVNTKEFE